MPKRKQEQQGSITSGLKEKPVPQCKQKLAKHETPIKPDIGRSRTTNYAEAEFPFKLSSAEELFESFISPCSVSNFFDEYWEQKPLLLANRTEVGSIAHYLFSKQILEDLTKNHEIDYEGDVCVSRYRNEKRESLNGEGQMKLSDLRRLMMKQKATLQFHQPQRFQEILWRIMEHLETKFDCLVGANVYMTPGGSQGLAPHYDDVEVFILQVEGEKRWRLYKPSQELPRNYSEDLSQTDIGKPTHDIILKPGDLLYFPRGTVHQAATPDTCSHSTHITFSTYQHNTWSDYLSKGLHRMLSSAFQTNLSFRRGLPQNFLSNYELSSRDNSVIQNLIGRLSQEVSSAHQQTVQEMRLNFIANRLPPYTDRNAVEEIQLQPKGYHVTHMRLKYPGHTCVVVEDSLMDIFTYMRAEDRVKDEDCMEEDEDGEDATERNGDGGEEEDDDDGESDEEIGGSDQGYINGHCKGEDIFKVYHSLGNDREMHMMATSQIQPEGYTFPMSLLDAFRHLERSSGQWVPVKELSLSGETDGMMFGDLVECKYGK